MKNWTPNAKKAVIAAAIILTALLLSQTVFKHKDDDTRAVLPTTL
jgi:hypothetical protein